MERGKLYEELINVSEELADEVLQSFKELDEGKESLSYENYLLRKEINKLKFRGCSPKYYVVEHTHGAYEDYYLKREIFVTRTDANKGFDARIKKAREDTWNDKICLYNGEVDDNGMIVPAGAPLLTLTLE